MTTAKAIAAVRDACGGHPVLLVVLDTIERDGANEALIDFIESEILGLTALKDSLAALKDLSDEERLVLKSKIWLTQAVLALACAARCSHKLNTQSLVRMALRFAKRAQWMKS
jgi:hypothetical protein